MYYKNKQGGTFVTENRKAELAGLAKEFRIEVIRTLHDVQTGHPGGSLSATEILVALYFEVMRIDPTQPQLLHRDRFVLSKGHAAPMLYTVLAHRGYFPVEEIKTLRQINSRLQGHPCAHKTPGVELSTGPLGLGVSAALGMALAARLQGGDEYIYVLMGDGELQEGIVWETAMAAAKFGADHLIVIVDQNGVQLDGTVEEIMPEGDLRAKFASFGWNVLSCDGHDIEQIVDSVQCAQNHTGSPTVILAQTVKGKGVSFMEGKNIWHGKPIDDAEYEQAMRELKEGVRA